MHLEVREQDVRRFWSKVALPNEQGCMLWLASCQPSGYGQISIGGTMRLAHRVSYQLAYGPVPDGLVTDHLCRVRHCVAPEHFEAVTSAENVRRGILGLRNRNRTHCPAGHPYDEANTRVRANGWRDCRACDVARESARRERRNAQRRARWTANRDSINAKRRARRAAQQDTR
jgi:hypothetical protein